MNEQERSFEETRPEYVGSFDQGPEVESIRAIDQALKHYFSTENWLAARNEQMPGTTRAGHWFRRPAGMYPQEEP